MKYVHTDVMWCLHLTSTISLNRHAIANALVVKGLFGIVVNYIIFVYWYVFIECPFVVYTCTCIEY